MDFCLKAHNPSDQRYKEFYVHSIDESDLLFDVILNVTGLEVPIWPEVNEQESQFLASSMELAQKSSPENLLQCIRGLVKVYWGNNDDYQAEDFESMAQGFLEQYLELQNFFQYCGGFVCE